MINELKQKLSKLENSTNFNELDFLIKESEMSRTLAKLKLNKSPGLDNISNNMLKNGQSILLPSLKKCLMHVFHLVDIPRYGLMDI
jgi:5-formyltetrahydrofolate cyclo-ligase